MSAAELIAVEADWKQATLSANARFADDGRAVADAVDVYRTALRLAETLAANAPASHRAGLPVVPVFIISCQNLAHALLARGEAAEADALMRRAAHFPLHLLREESAPDTDAGLIEAARAGLRRATLAYAEFAKKEGLPDTDRDLRALISSAREEAASAS